MLMPSLQGEEKRGNAAQTLCRYFFLEQKGSASQSDIRSTSRSKKGARVENSKECQKSPLYIIAGDFFRCDMISKKKCVQR
jgi:hypothetical protein